MFYFFTLKILDNVLLKSPHNFLGTSFSSLNFRKYLSKIVKLIGVNSNEIERNANKAISSEILKNMLFNLALARIEFFKFIIAKVPGSTQLDTDLIPKLNNLPQLCL